MMMRFAQLLSASLLLAATVSDAFQHVAAPGSSGRGSPAFRQQPLRMSSTETGNAPIVVKGQNVELTPALTDYVEKRIGGHLNKLSGSDGAVRECDVILSVSKNPKVRFYAITPRQQCGCWVVTFLLYFPQ